MLGNLFVALSLVVLITIATGVAMDVLMKLSHQVRARKIFLASVIVGLSVSLPELFIGISASLVGAPQLAIGDLIGANLSNLSWVIGGAALVGGVIPVVGDYIAEDLWITMILVLTPFLLMADGNLNRFDAMILLFGYLLYTNDMIKKGRFKIRQAKIEKHLIKRSKKGVGRSIQMIKLAVALIVLAYCAVKLVGVSIVMAESLGVSTFWMGLIFVAISTTLPELIVIFEELSRRKMSLLMESLMGSVVVNSSLVIAIIGLIRPVELPETAQKGVAGISIVVILGLFWLFTKTKHRLDRWEGAVLVGVYLMFLGAQLLL